MKIVYIGVLMVFRCRGYWCNRMMIKSGCLFLTLLAATLALPLNEVKDTSVFFKQTAPFIVGGTVAGPVPHMVGLTIGIPTRMFVCGGSLITNRHVLTAAHCIDSLTRQGELLSSLRGIVGTDRWSTGGTAYPISHNITHPDWNLDILKNDIGILVTSSTVTLNSAVQTVVLNYNFIPGNVPTILNGWGKLDFGEPSVSPILMELRPYTVDGRQCIADVARVSKEVKRPVPNVDPELEICAFLNVNVGACFSDSGSALILAENKQQIGVTSWGIPCARGAPDMYARVSAYQSWIQQSTR